MIEFLNQTLRLLLSPSPEQFQEREGIILLQWYLYATIQKICKYTYSDL